MKGIVPRSYFPDNSCLSRKENTFGVGFPLRGEPAKQQGPGSQRQPRPSLAYGDKRARGEKGKRCFGEERRIGAVVCSPRRVYLLEYSSLHGVWIGAWDVVSVLRSLAISAGLMGLTPRRHSPANSCLSRKENTFGVGFPFRGAPVKQQGRGSQRQPRPSLALETRGLGEKKASVALVRKGTLGLWFVPRGESTLPECSSLHGVWSRA